MSFFFIASTNPSSWVISGLGTFWVFLYLILTASRVSGAPFWIAGCAAVASAGLALAARGDGIVYLTACTAAVGAVAWPRLRHLKMRRNVLFGALAFGFLALVTIPNLRFRVMSLIGLNQDGGSLTPDASVVADGVNPYVNHLLELPSFLTALVGNQDGNEHWPTAYTRGLGWLDIQPPTFVGLFSLFCLSAVAFWGLNRYSRSRLLGASALVVALIAMVYLPLASVHFASTFTVQPRYFLPLLLPLIGVLTFVEHPSAHLSKVQRWLLVLLLSASFAVALLAFIRRNTNGAAVPWFRWDLEPSWWWTSGGFTPTVVWMLGTAAAVAFLSIMAALTEDTRADAGDHKARVVLAEEQR